MTNATNWQSELQQIEASLQKLDTALVATIASTPIPDIRTLSEKGLKISLARAEMKRRGIPFDKPIDGDSSA